MTYITSHFDTYDCTHNGDETPKERSRRPLQQGNHVGSPDFETTFHINSDASLFAGFLRFGEYYFGRMCKRREETCSIFGNVVGKNPERKGHISDEDVDGS